MRGLAAATILVTLAYTAWLFAPGGNRELLGNLLGQPPLWLAVALGLAGARRQPREARTAWTLIALSGGAYALGTGIWAVEQVLLHVKPFPSVADAAYACTVPLLAWGVLRLPRRRLSRERARRAAL
ncbi:MAG TPA: hypothetical protein VHN99_03160, partial [Deinococcales bacterium]|nr:hypothetical protein [Deinococcales bacterium]